MINAMMIDPRDDVAVAIEEIEKGGSIAYVKDGRTVTLTALTNITIYHKFAIHDIKKGDAVSKYGEHIGIASCDIQTGEHVHVHNIEDHRENLDD